MRWDMNIKKMIDSLNLVYYEYDSTKKLLRKDENYTNRYTDLEFFKITYYLSKYHIAFNVLKNKSIILSEKKFEFKNYLLKLLENMKNAKQNIFLLNDKKVRWAQNIPLFKIVYKTTSIDLKKYDALLFTSKNGIKAIDSFNKDWKKIPAYVMSQQSAKLLKDMNGKLEYISKTKHGNEFAYELVEKLQGKKVLYLRGKELVSDLINILKTNEIECKDEVIYENIFNKEVKKRKIPSGSKIIFTSPSTIKYFFRVFTWDDSYTAISIGKTTAKYFPENISPIIADDTSFHSCVSKALSI